MKRGSFFSKQEIAIKKVLELNEMQNLYYLKKQEYLNAKHTFSPEFEKKMNRLFRVKNKIKRITT